MRFSTLIPSQRGTLWLYLAGRLTILAEFEVFAKRVARAIKAAFPCKKVAQVVLGLEVNHAHIHLLPMNSEADVDFKHHVKLTEEEFQEIAEKIRKEFK